MTRGAAGSAARVVGKIIRRHGKGNHERLFQRDQAITTLIHHSAFGISLFLSGKGAGWQRLTACAFRLTFFAENLRTDTFMSSTGVKTVFADAIELLVNFMGFVGVVLVLYGTTSALLSNPWPVIDMYSDIFSSIVTIVGTSVAASSVYFYESAPAPPKQISIYVTAPTVLLGCGCALLVIGFGETHTLPLSVLNGFALLGLAGAMFRILPAHKGPSDTDRDQSAG